MVWGLCSRRFPECLLGTVLGLVVGYSGYGGAVVCGSFACYLVFGMLCLRFGWLWLVVVLMFAAVWLVVLGSGCCYWLVLVFA